MGVGTGTDMWKARALRIAHDDTAVLAAGQGYDPTRAPAGQPAPEP
jgi:hypothetical protein